MKFLVPALALAALTLTARADLVVEQQMESSFINGVMTFKIKGDTARMDMPSVGGAGGMTSLINTTSGEITTLMHAQKMAMKMSLADMRKKGEEMQKAQGIDLTKIKPVATGAKSKIGDWNADEYTVQVGTISSHMWVAKDFPNAKSYRDQLAKFSKAMGGGGQFDPNALDIPGMVVKSETETPQGKITMTLKKIKEEAVPASEFVAPTDYQAMDVPKGLGGQ